MELGLTDMVSAALRAQSFPNCEERAEMSNCLHFKCSYCSVVIDIFDNNSTTLITVHMKVTHPSEELVVKLLTLWAAETLVSLSKSNDRPDQVYQPVPPPFLEDEIPSPSNWTSSPVLMNWSPSPLQQAPPLVDAREPATAIAPSWKQFHRCKKCKKHGKIIRRKAHACSYKQCSCHKCQSVEETRKKWRDANAMMKERRNDKLH